LALNKKVVCPQFQSYIATIFQRWRSLYQAYYHNLGWPLRLDIESEAEGLRFSWSEFQQTCFQLAQQLNAWFEADLVGDRIILIGAVGSHKTPHSVGVWQDKMPGVFIHAHMISQLLSAVLEGRNLIWWWPQWQECLWIGCWSLSGGLIAAYWHPSTHKCIPAKSGKLTKLNSLLSLGLALILLGISCFISFLHAGWLPLIPAASGLIVAGAASQLGQAKSKATQKIPPLSSSRKPTP
jgi:CHASE2 domain-containing sensor protein